MEQHSKDVSGKSSEFLGTGWFDPIEEAIRSGFVASSRNSWMPNWTGRWVGCATAGRRRQRKRAEPPGIGMEGGRGCSVRWDK